MSTTPVAPPALRRTALRLVLLFVAGVMTSMLLWRLFATTPAPTARVQSGTDAVALIRNGAFESLPVEVRRRVAEVILDQVDRGALAPSDFLGTPQEQTMRRVMMTAMDARAAAYARLTDPAEKTAFLDSELDKMKQRLANMPPRPQGMPVGEQKAMLENENPLTIVTRFNMMSAMARRAEQRGMKLPGPFSKD